MIASERRLGARVGEALLVRHALNAGTELGSLADAQLVRKTCGLLRHLIVSLWTELEIRLRRQDLHARLRDTQIERVAAAVATMTIPRTDTEVHTMLAGFRVQSARDSQLAARR